MMLFDMPLHPVFVHFPIALLLFGTLLILLSLKWASFKLFALLTMIFGLLSGGIAYLTGEGSEDYAETTLRATEQAIDSHSTFALISLATFGGVLLLLLANYRFHSKGVVIIAFIIALVGCGLLAYTGHLGGKMVYNP